MAVTIEDVALHAGVSITTVSRVLNNTGYPVSAETREKSLQSADALKYIPNRAAQLLRQGGKNGIALIVRNINDPYFSEIAKAVTETSIGKDIVSSVFNSVQNPEFELKFYTMILTQHYEGVIIAGGAYEDRESISRLHEIVKRLQTQGCRVLALAPQGFDVPMVSVDNFEVGRSSMEYLLSKGHKNIAFLGGYKGHLADNKRFQGSERALMNHGFAYKSNTVYNSEYSPKGGYETCKKLMESGFDGTAIFCSNDHIARGAMKYLKERGLRVPEDISIMGVCGLYCFSDYVDNQGLTTVLFPFYEMGKRAVELISGDEELPMDYQELLETKIVENSSVRDA